MQLKQMGGVQLFEMGPVQLKQMGGVQLFEMETG